MGKAKKRRSLENAERKRLRDQEQAEHSNSSNKEKGTSMRGPVTLVVAATAFAGTLLWVLKDKEEDPSGERNMPEQVDNNKETYVEDITKVPGFDINIAPSLEIDKEELKVLEEIYKSLKPLCDDINQKNTLYSNTSETKYLSDSIILKWIKNLSSETQEYIQSYDGDIETKIRKALIKKGYMFSSSYQYIDNQYKPTLLLTKITGSYNIKLPQSEIFTKQSSEKRISLYTLEKNQNSQMMASYRRSIKTITLSPDSRKNITTLQAALGDETYHALMHNQFPQIVQLAKNISSINNHTIPEISQAVSAYGSLVIHKNNPKAFAESLNTLLAGKSQEYRLSYKFTRKSESMIHNTLQKEDPRYTVQWKKDGEINPLKYMMTTSNIPSEVTTEILAHWERELIPILNIIQQEHNKLSPPRINNHE